MKWSEGTYFYNHDVKHDGNVRKARKPPDINTQLREKNYTNRGKHILEHIFPVLEYVAYEKDGQERYLS